MEFDAHWIEDALPDIYLSLFPTGYVIELEKDRYFAGIKAGKICCTPVDLAKYFATIKQAECCVHRKLGFIGMRVRICRVCWTLVETETLETDWRFVTDGDGNAVKFATYREAENYQKERALQKSSRIEIYAFREKEMLLAA